MELTESLRREVFRTEELVAKTRQNMEKELEKIASLETAKQSPPKRECEKVRKPYSSPHLLNAEQTATLSWSTIPCRMPPTAYPRWRIGLNRLVDQIWNSSMALQQLNMFSRDCKTNSGRNESKQRSTVEYATRKVMYCDCSKEATLQHLFILY